MTKDFRDLGRKLAERKIIYKYHVLIYFIINILFWTMWYISLKNVPKTKTRINFIPWPVWPLVGWGIVLILHYVAVYKINNLQQKEYDKLHRNKNNRLF